MFTIITFLVGCAPFEQQSSEVFLLLDSGAILHSRLSISDSGIMRQQGHAATMLWQHKQTPLGSILHSTEADSEWQPELKRIGTAQLQLSSPRSLKVSQAEFNLRTELTPHSGSCVLQFANESWTIHFSDQWSNGWLHASGNATALRGVVTYVERIGLVNDTPVSELIVGSSPDRQLLWVRIGEEAQGCLKKGSQILSAQKVDSDKPDTEGSFRVDSQPQKTLGTDEPYASHTMLDKLALWTTSTPQSLTWSKAQIEESGTRWTAFRRVAQ